MLLLSYSTYRNYFSLFLCMDGVNFLLCYLFCSVSAHIDVFSPGIQGQDGAVFISGLFKLFNFIIYFHILASI